MDHAKSAAARAPQLDAVGEDLHFDLLVAALTGKVSIICNFMQAIQDFIHDFLIGKATGIPQVVRHLLQRALLVGNAFLHLVARPDKANLQIGLAAHQVEHLSGPDLL